jgi:hypothetical protein
LDLEQIFFAQIFVLIIFCDTYQNIMNHVFVLAALAPALVVTYALSSPTPKSPNHYDLVVIGGGSAGLTAAKVSLRTL